VENYSKALWQTADTALAQDWPRLLANIEKGEAKVSTMFSPVPHAPYSVDRTFPAHCSTSPLLRAAAAPS
jgi:hypothetical protein